MECPGTNLGSAMCAEQFCLYGLCMRSSISQCIRSRKSYISLLLYFRPRVHDLSTKFFEMGRLGIITDLVVVFSGDETTDFGVLL